MLIQDCSHPTLRTNMAGVKRKHECDDTITGYVHNTTNVKTATSTNTRYLTGTLQVSDSEFVRFISFSPEKIDAFQTAERTKSPVKLADVLVAPKRGSKEVTINRRSIVTVSRNLSFERSTEIPSSSSETIKLKDATEPNLMCTVGVKVLKVNPVEEQSTRYGQRRMQKCVIADETSSALICLWAENTSKLDEGKSYRLTNVLTNSFQGNMQLSSTSFTRITPITEMQEVREQEPVIRLEELKGSVICCSIKTVVKCINCSKQIEHPSNVTIVRCDSCNAKQKICAINQSKVVNLQVMDATDSMRKFVVFNKQFSEFINLHNLQQKNNEEIGNFILNRSEIKLCHHENSDIVQKLE